MVPPLAEHHEHVPSRALAPWVARAVGYRLSGFAAGVHVGMPLGSLTLVIPLDAPLTLTDPPGGVSAYGSVELADVLGPDVERLREQLHGTDSWERRFALVDGRSIPGRGGGALRLHGPGASDP